MTRTERSAFPRALAKDRSLSRSGLDKSMRKDGAGAHSWGKLTNEAELEFAALDDEQLEAEIISEANSEHRVKKLSAQRSASSLSNEEAENARQFRKTALKTEGIDLAAIARTSSAVSSSPTD